MPKNGIDSLVVQSLRDPLILVNELGRVVFKNEAADILVGEQAENKHLASVLRVPDVLSAVENVLNGREPERVEYTMPVPVERSFEAFIAPLDKSVARQS
ncbi:MAG: two-component system phosphate regulon sensor histidine kinase PhoR, partial [Parvibaculaceae bacterium]